MINILVYDDNPQRRESLEALIELTQEFNFVGSFENCSSIREDVEACKPDIILMDIEMPLANGLEGLRLIKQFYPQVKVIMQTAFDDDEKVFAAIQAGAEGYMLKHASVMQIIQSIQEVMNGGASMSPAIALKVMRHFSSQPQKEDYSLTAKETETLKHLSQGLSYKMIADQMGISYFTVNNHVKKIYEKLHVHSLGEAVALAHRQRLV